MSRPTPLPGLPPLQHRPPFSASIPIPSSYMDTPPLTGTSTASNTFLQTPQPPTPGTVTPLSLKRSFPPDLGSSDTTIAGIVERARVRDRLTRQERAVTHRRRIFDPNQGRIAPRPLPEDYVPTPAPVDEQPSRYPLTADWITSPPRDAFSWLAEPQPQPTINTVVNTQLHHSIQEAVDRRIAFDALRDARMYPHVGDAYTPARLAALADSMRETDNWQRLTAVSGPGGGQWGDTLAYPYHATSEDPLDRPLFDGSPYRPRLQTSFHPDQTHEERQETVRSIMTHSKRNPNNHMAAMTVREAQWGDCPRAEEGCAVCHDDYVYDSQVSLTPCDHMYHTECFNTWLAQPASTCPMCRRDLAALAIIQKSMADIGSSEDARSLWMSVAVL